MEYADFYDDDYRDQWHPIGCDLPGCIMPSGHYASECHTAQDAVHYDHHMHGEPIPWHMREPFYTIALAWDYVRFRDERTWRALHFHWHCDFLPSVRRFFRPAWSYRVWPQKCRECGRRWRECEGCLPF